MKTWKRSNQVQECYKEKLWGKHWSLKKTNKAVKIKGNIESCFKLLDYEIVKKEKEKWWFNSLYFGNQIRLTIICQVICKLPWFWKSMVNFNIMNSRLGCKETINIYLYYVNNSFESRNKIFSKNKYQIVTWWMCIKRSKDYQCLFEGVWVWGNDFWSACYYFQDWDLFIDYKLAVYWDEN